MADDERDKQLGRAIVKDDSELKEYYRDLERVDTGALWTVANVCCGTSRNCGSMS